MTILDRLRAGALTASADETQELAAALASVLPADATLALHGDLGAGKTTFVQGLARGLGVTDAVTSPTFTICTVHRGRPCTLVHLDAYRLKDAAGLDALMLDDALAPPYCVAVEWPENIAAWLPDDTLHLFFSIEPDERRRIHLR